MRHKTFWKCAINDEISMELFEKRAREQNEWEKRASFGIMVKLHHVPDCKNIK